MKKLLALVLALVMTLGLATVGANAAYKDADDINYDEAVDVMSAIGVLAGDETGFRPADTLKRSEGAKIVAYLMVGNGPAEALQGSGTKFTDLPANHWASGYMEYLASVGIMGGVGDGKIDPDGQLTATAFGKMLLCALGYDAEIEGFGGTDWSINVQKVANQVGIYDGNRAVVGSAAVTREEAALYAFNTILSPLVEYDTQVNVSLDNGQIKVGSNKALYLASTKGGDQTISFEEVEDGKYYVEFAEKYYPDLVLETRAYDESGYGPDEFARPSREWTYKKAEVGSYIATAGLIKTFTGKVTKKNLYDTLGKTTYDSLSDYRTELNVAVDGLAKVYKSEAITAYNTNTGYDWSLVNVDNYINRNDTGAVNGTDNGSVTQVFMDEDSNVYVATYHTYVFQAAADYSTTKESILIEPAGDTNAFITLDSLTLEAKDFPEVKDLKDDDYILITANQAHFDDTSKFEVYSVAKAELVTGTVEGYKLNSNVTIDGTTYNYSTKTTKAGDTTEGDANVKTTNYSVGRKATIVLDAYNNVIAVDDAVVDENFVFIAAIGNTSSLSSKVIADAYFTDGTNKEIVIDKFKTVADPDGLTKTEMVKLSQTGINTDNHGIGVVNGADGGTDKTFLHAGWFTYSVDDDGEYALAEITADNTDQTGAWWGHNDTNAQTILVNNRVNFSADPATTGATLAANDFDAVIGTKAVANLKANDKTIVVVSDGSDVFTYTGVKNIPDVTIVDDDDTDTKTGAAAMFAVYNTNNDYASYVFVALEGNVNFYDAATTNLLYVLSKEGTYTTTNNKTYTKYNVLDENGSKIVVEADGTDPFGAGDVYKAQYRVSKNSADRYTRGLAVTEGAPSGGYFALTNKQNGISYSAGTLNMGGESFTLADDAKITVVVKKSANALNKDKDAAYEATRVSASTLASMVKNYNVTYSVQGKVDGTYANPTANRVLKEAYVTITAAASAGEYGIASATMTTYDAGNDALVAANVTNSLKASAALAWASPVEIDLNAAGTPTQFAVTATGNSGNAVTIKWSNGNVTTSPADTVTATAYTAGTKTANGTASQIYVFSINDQATDYAESQNEETKFLGIKFVNSATYGLEVQSPEANALRYTIYTDADFTQEYSSATTDVIIGATTGVTAQVPNGTYYVKYTQNPAFTSKDYADFYTAGVVINNGTAQAKYSATTVGHFAITAPADGGTVTIKDSAGHTVWTDDVADGTAFDVYASVANGYIISFANDAKYYEPYTSAGTNITTGGTATENIGAEYKTITLGDLYTGFAYNVTVTHATKPGLTVSDLTDKSSVVLHVLDTVGNYAVTVTSDAGVVVASSEAFASDKTALTGVFTDVNGAANLYAEIFTTPSTAITVANASDSKMKITITDVAATGKQLISGIDTTAAVIADIRVYESDDGSTFVLKNLANQSVDGDNFDSLFAAAGYDLGTGATVDGGMKYFKIVITFRDGDLNTITTLTSDVTTATITST